MFQRCIRATIFMAFLGCTLSNASIDRISMIGNKFIELIEDPGVSVFDVRGLFGKELREMWARDRKAFLGEHYEIACQQGFVVKRSVRFGRNEPRHAEEVISNKALYTFCATEGIRLMLIIGRYRKQRTSQLAGLLAPDEMSLFDDAIVAWNAKVAVLIEGLEVWAGCFYEQAETCPAACALVYYRKKVL